MAMNDDEKTKDQLIEELTALRNHVAELAKSALALIETGADSKPAEQGPAQSLTSIVDLIPDATYAIDAEGTIIIWHKGMEKLTGIKAEEMLGKGNYEYSLPFFGVRKPTLIDLVLGPDRTEIERDFLFIQKDGDLISAEYYVFLKGNQRVVYGRARPLYDSEGNIMGAIEDIRDVTERKRMEESIQESERKYQEVVENINEVIYIAERDGRITYISPVVETALGYHPSEVIGRSLSDFIFPEDLESVVENARIVLEGRISPNEFRLYKKSGELCWVRTSIRPRSERGHITFQGVLTDITDMKIAEELYETLANSSRAGVYIAEGGRIRFVNPHIPKYSGYSEIELLGMEVLDIVHPEDRELVRKNAVEMLKGTRSAPYEFRMIDRNGRIRRLIGTVTPVTYQGRPAVLGNTMEITDKRQRKQRTSGKPALTPGMTTATSLPSDSRAPRGRRAGSDRPQYGGHRRSF